MDNKGVLTAEDVARILQVGKNTVYTLAKNGTLGSYNIGRKLRFTLADVETYLADSRNVSSQATKNPRQTLKTEYAFYDAPWSDAKSNSHTFKLGGTDVILDMLANYISDLGVLVHREHRNSYQSLVDLYFGRLDAAAVCLWDSSSSSYNIPFVKRLVPGVPLVVIHLATYMQGLMVQKGNPRAIKSWGGLLEPDIVLANREKGSAPRILLDEQLRMMEANPSNINGYEREVPSALAVGTLISKREADVGVGTERITRQIQAIDYIPIQEERLVLVVAKRIRNEQALRTVVSCLKNRAFKASTATLGNYNFARMGDVIYET